MFKNKFRIIQIILIFTIFFLTGYYLTKADSIYEVKTSGDKIISLNNIDTIDLKNTLSQNNIQNIHYKIFKGEEQVIDGNFGLEILNTNNQIIDLPYVNVEQSGMNLNEFDLYIDGKKMKELINKGNTDIIKEFYVNFYTFSVDSTGESSTKFDLNCKRKIVLNYEEINEENMNLGNFYLQPTNFYKDSIGLSNLSNLLLKSYNASTNSYEYDLNIEMGGKENIKQYIYNIELLANIFPNTNLLNISNVSIQPDDNNDFINVEYTNKIKDYSNNNVTINEFLKSLVITTKRVNDNYITTNNKYNITLNTLKDDLKINIILNINLKADKLNSEISGYRFVYENETTQIINKYIGESDISLNLNYNKAPSSFKIKNSKGEDLTNSTEFKFKNASLNDYLTYSNDTYSKEFVINKETPDGFYTIESYEPTNKVYITNEENIDEEATLNTQVRTTAYTFYVQKGMVKDLSLDFIDDGYSLDVSSNELTINIPTNNNNSLNNIALDGILTNGTNIIDNTFDYKVINNLTEKKAVNGVIISNNIMKISGTITNDSFYLLVYPKTTQSYFIYKINIVHKGIKDLVVGLNVYPTSFNVPSSKDIESAEITPTIKMDGVLSDITKLNYDYKFYQLVNSEYKEINNENIYVIKGDGDKKGKDILYVTDFAPTGTFMIECYIKDKDAESAKTIFNVNYEQNQNNEYEIKFLNEKDKVSVPSKVGNINTIDLSTKVLKNGIETTIKPSEFTVTGDENVLIKNNNLIIKNGAKIGNTIIVTSKLIGPEKEIIASKSMNFVLVEQGKGDENISETDPSETTAPNDSENKPNTIILSGFETEQTTNFLNYTKASAEKKTLKYVCYDSKGNVISNPSISIKINSTNNSGFSSKVDYKTKEITITSNGLYEDKTITIEFKNENNIIKDYTIILYKPKLYDYTFNIVQKDIVRNGKILAQASFKNNSLLDMNVLLAVVCYDKNESMVSYVQTPVTVKSGGEIKTNEPIEAKLTVPEDSRDLVIKAYLLDGTTLENSKGYYAKPLIITNREDY